MNFWKPLAIVSTGALALVVGAPQFVGLAVPVAQAGNQPNMEQSLAKLREARGFLDHAEHNKGGHRDRAIEFTNKAIEEVNAGINYADR